MRSIGVRTYAIVPMTSALSSRETRRSRRRRMSKRRKCGIRAINAATAARAPRRLWRVTSAMSIPTRRRLRRVGRRARTAAGRADTGSPVPRILDSAPRRRSRLQPFDDALPRLHQRVHDPAGRPGQLHGAGHRLRRDLPEAGPVLEALGKALEPTRLRRLAGRVFRLQELDEVQYLVKLLVRECLEFAPQALAHHVVHGRPLRGQEYLPRTER